MQYELKGSVVAAIELRDQRFFDLRQAFYACRNVRELTRGQVECLVKEKFTKIEDFERGKTGQNDKEFLTKIEKQVKRWQKERRAHDAGRIVSELLAIADAKGISEADFPLPENFAEAFELANA